MLTLRLRVGEELQIGEQRYIVYSVGPMNRVYSVTEKRELTLGIGPNVLGGVKVILHGGVGRFVIDIDAPRSVEIWWPGKADKSNEPGGRGADIRS